MADVHDGDRFTRFIERVPDAILAAPRSPLTLERLAQRRPDPVRISGQRPPAEVDLAARALLCGIPPTPDQLGRRLARALPDLRSPAAGLQHDQRTD